MKTLIAIQKEMDKMFIEACLDFPVSYSFIKDDEDCKIYEVTHQFQQDLLYLGVSIGMKKAQEIYRS